MLATCTTRSPCKVIRPSTSRMTFLFLIVLCVACHGFIDTECHCGWMANCNGTECICNQGFKLHTNGRDCLNASCTPVDCLQCGVSTTVCTRCLSFMSSSTGLCLQKCHGSAEKRGYNIICTESGDDGVNLEIAIAAGVGAGAVLCIIIISIVCLYIRRTRKRINLQNRSFQSGQLQIGHVKQFPVFDNNAFESDDQMHYKPNKIDPLLYANELDKLRPHTDTLMILLSQVRTKTRAMNTSDPRLPTYKGVIHQFTRVLTLLHKKDPVLSIPSDALGLIQWAQQMLDDCREQQSSSGGTSEYPVAQISSVDLDPSLSPVYASPEESLNFDITLQPVASPYSSVPVPITIDAEHPRCKSSNQKPGYATISRTPSIPNGDLLKSFEKSSDDGISTENTFEEPCALPKKSNFQGSEIHRGDFSSFLINSPQTPKTTAKRRPSHKTPPPELFNTSSESYGDIDFSNNAHFQQGKRPQKDEEGSAATSLAKPPLKPKPKQIATASKSESENQPSFKKNIITNPNIMLKSNSVNRKTDLKPPLKSVKSLPADPKAGYFANGHYYEPNPMPQPNPDIEVYAPGSSYSNRSNVMSTFLGDAPLSSASYSDHSDDVSQDSDNSGGDLDIFPFDPKDATDPVQV